MFHRAKKTPMKTRAARRMMEQMFHLAWRKVTAVTDEARKALSTRDDAMVTLEQLSAASAEPIEHLRNYVLAGVLTCDERGMFPLRSSMLAILDFWEWKGASRLMVPPLAVQPLRLHAVIRISEKGESRGLRSPRTAT
jgi:hypothetical protein